MACSFLTVVLAYGNMLGAIPLTNALRTLDRDHVEPRNRHRAGGSRSSAFMRREQDSRSIGKFADV